MEGGFNGGERDDEEEKKKRRRRRKMKKRKKIKKKNERGCERGRQCCIGEALKTSHCFSMPDLFRD